MDRIAQRLRRVEFMLPPSSFRVTLFQSADYFQCTALGFVELVRTCCIQFQLTEGIVKHARFYYFPKGLATRDGIESRKTVHNQSDWMHLVEECADTLINLYFVYDFGTYQSPAMVARPSGPTLLQGPAEAYDHTRSEKESVEGLRQRDGPGCVLCGSLTVNNCHILDKHRLELLNGMPNAPDHGVEDLTNYITLCPTHHAMFDRYLFS